jgi:hypothetical protein
LCVALLDSVSLSAGVDWTAGDAEHGTASGYAYVPRGDGTNQQVGITFSAVDISSGSAIPVPIKAVVLDCDAPADQHLWSPSGPYISNEIPNAPPGCDALLLDGTGTPNTIYTVTLSENIQDPIMAINSLGSQGDSAEYDFGAPFQLLVPTDPSAVGAYDATYGALTVIGNNLIGLEGAGVIKFIGTYNEFQWSVPNGENCPSRRQREQRIE